MILFTSEFKNRYSLFDIHLAPPLGVDCLFAYRWLVNMLLNT